MAEIVHQLQIRAPRRQVFQWVATGEGLARWWSLRSEGEARLGATFHLDFGPEYLWEAEVSCAEGDAAFELTFTTSDDDWLGTRVRFDLASVGAGLTEVRFSHTGWPRANAHWRISSHCWALYLRLLRRGLEHGEFVPYEQRLDA